MDNPKSYSELFADFRGRFLALRKGFMEPPEMQFEARVDGQPVPFDEDLRRLLIEQSRRRLYIPGQSPWRREEEYLAKPTAINAGRLVLSAIQSGSLRA